MTAKILKNKGVRDPRVHRAGLQHCLRCDHLEPCNAFRCTMCGGAVTSVIPPVGGREKFTGAV